MALFSHIGVSSRRNMALSQPVTNWKGTLKNITKFYDFCKDLSLQRLRKDFFSNLQMTDC